jgi:hypothetical protein
MRSITAKIQGREFTWTLREGADSQGSLFDTAITVYSRIHNCTLPETSYMAATSRLILTYPDLPTAFAFPTCRRTDLYS